MKKRLAIALEMRYTALARASRFAIVRNLTLNTSSTKSTPFTGMKAHLPKPLRLLLFAAMFALDAGYAEDYVFVGKNANITDKEEYLGAESGDYSVSGAVVANNVTIPLGTYATNGGNLTIEGIGCLKDGSTDGPVVYENVAVYGDGNTFEILAYDRNNECGDLLIGSESKPAAVVGSGNWLLVGSSYVRADAPGGSITVGNIYGDANILAACEPISSGVDEGEDNEGFDEGEDEWFEDNEGFDEGEDEGGSLAAASDNAAEEVSETTAESFWEIIGVQGDINAGDIVGNNNQLLARGSVKTGAITGNGNIIAGATSCDGDEAELRTAGFDAVRTVGDLGVTTDITTGSVAGNSNTLEASNNVTVNGDLTGEGNTVKAGNDVTVTGDAELNGGRIEAGQSIALQGDTQLGTGVLKVGDSQEVRSKEGESATLSGIKLTTDSLTATGEGENRGSISGADITAKGLTTISRIDISDSNILLSLKAGTTLTLSDVSIGQSTTFTDSNGSASRATVKDSSLELTQVTVVPAADNNTAAASTSFDMGRVSVSGKLTLNLTQELMSVLVANGVNYAGGIPTLTVSLTNIGNASELGRDNFAVTNLSNQYSTPSIGSVTVNGNNATVVVIFDPVVPEPATATLSLLALAGLCARRRRK